MKKALACVSLGTLTAAMVVGAASVARAADGKTLFLENKCNMCHSIDSQGIKKTAEKMKGAELSDAGNLITSADWVKSFLKQTEMKDGAKHQKKFTGSDQELDAIVSWLMTLKK